VRFFRKHLSRVALGWLLVALFVWAGLHDRQGAWLQRLDLLTYDLRLRLTAPTAPDSRIVIVGVDEVSLAAEGRWPWSRDKMAALIQTLVDRYGVTVVGLDFIFQEASDPTAAALLSEIEQATELRHANPRLFESLRSRTDPDAAFAAVLERYPVVLAYGLAAARDTGARFRVGAIPPPMQAAQGAWVIDTADSYTGILPRFLARAALRPGHARALDDIDGVVRRSPVVVRLDDGLHESFAVALARAALTPDRVQLETIAAADATFATALHVGDRVVPLDNYGAVYVPYRAARRGFAYVSARDVLRGAAAREALDGRIAIVAATAQGLRDVGPAPLERELPRVEAQASILAGILDGSFKRADTGALALYWWWTGVGAFALSIAFLSVGPWGLLVLGATGAAALVLANFWAWRYADLVLPLVLPLLLIASLVALNVVYALLVEARQRRLLASLFGQYVPASLVDKLADAPEEHLASLAGVSRDLSVLFSDVRDFTTVSESMSPTELRNMLNEYLSPMTECIYGTGGTVDKYIGDAIMAFWGAPLADANHAAHAVAAALDMQRRLGELREAFARKGWPRIEIGVGINCGPMSVGDMGSRFRRAYTVLGDAVNLAARLESLTREYGVPILVTEHVVAQCASVEFREVDRVRVKGKQQQVAIYEPLGPCGQVAQARLDARDKFQRALTAYRAEHWDQAAALLRELAAAEPQERLYRCFAARVERYRQEPPPPGWNGVHVFHAK
jgi:adenylate cyclase